MSEGQVQLGRLGLGLIAAGTVQLAWMGFCSFGALIFAFAWIMHIDPHPLLPGAAGAWLVLGCISLLVAAVQLGAGIRMRMGGGLYLGLVALAISLVSPVFALYCWPLTLVVLVQGLAVYLRPEVRALFASARARS